MMNGKRTATVPVVQAVVPAPAVSPVARPGGPAAARDRLLRLPQPTEPTVGEMVPPVVFVEVHESVEDCPRVMVVGLRESVQAGLAEFTVTVTVLYVVHEVKY